MTVGYCRVSSEGQNLDRQTELMKELNVEKVYMEKVSGKNITDREELKKMMTFVRTGDVVVVSELSRFGRSTRDLINLIEELNNKGVRFISKKEGIDTSEDNPFSRFILNLFSSLAQLEREQIRQRQREGIELGKLNGKFKGGRKRITKPQNFDVVVKRWKDGEITGVECMKILGLKKGTFYNMVKD